MTAVFPLLWTAASVPERLPRSHDRFSGATDASKPGKTPFPCVSQQESRSMRTYALYGQRPKRFGQTCRNVLAVVVVALIGLLGAGSDAAARVQARSAILLEADTGKVLYEQDADRAIPPASLTKVLSMYVAMDAISSGKAKLNTPVAVSRKAAGQGGSRMHLKARESVPLDRLLLGMAVSSGNDASVAVAEYVAGSEERFVRLMNQKMRQLGLKRSVFKNAHGLPARGQVTTAREMAVLSQRYLKAYPQSLRYHRSRALRHNGIVTTNKNPLLDSFPGADGLKTGWISASGYNIISTVKRGNTRLVAVILGASSGLMRSQEIHRLMEAGFDAAEKRISVASALEQITPRYAEPPARKAVASDTKKKKKKSSVASASASKKRKKPAARASSKSTPRPVAAKSGTQSGSLSRL